MIRAMVETLENPLLSDPVPKKGLPLQRLIVLVYELPSCLSSLGSGMAGADNQKMQ